MRRKLAYISTPYSHELSEVREERIHLIAKEVALLHNEGVLGICPVLAGHILASDGLVDGDFKTWKEVDKALIELLDEFIVLMFPGWQDSVGVNEELKLAHDLGKFVWYRNPKSLRSQNNG